MTAAAQGWDPQLDNRERERDRDDISLNKSSGMLETVPEGEGGSSQQTTSEQEVLVEPPPISSTRPPLPTPPTPLSLPPQLPPLPQLATHITPATPDPDLSPARPRANLPTPPSPASPSPSPTPLAAPAVERSNSLASERSQDFALPLQFSPTAPHHPPLGHRASSSTTIPPFAAAPAFSTQDRGPYPPHVFRSSQSSIPGAGVRESYYSGLGSMDGPYPTPSAKGKARASDEVDLARRASQFYNPAAVAIVGSAPGSAAPTTAAEPSSSPPEPRATARVNSGGGGVVSGEFRDSMVGVGRNSIIRGPGALSPTSQNLLLGPAPGTSPTTPGSFAQQQQPNGQQQQQQPPPHLVQQPEICVECMMRDRDMVDVDVTGDGVWERESDQDFEEAMRWDEESTGGSEESGGAGAGGRIRRGSRDGGPPVAGSSRESHGGRGSAYGAPPRKKLGRGQPLTSPNLKLWTNMNPPASQHRWRTLQTFLAMQIHLLELERHARESTLLERDRLASRPSSDSRQSSSTPSSPLPPLLSSLGRSHKSASTVLPNGLLVESINVDRDEKQGRARAKSRSRLDQEPSSPGGQNNRQSLAPSLLPEGYESGGGGGDDLVRMYSSGDQPWLAAQPRRFSSPALKNSPSSPARPTSTASSSFRGFAGLSSKFARSSTDLRSIGTPRSLSPGRASLGVDNEDRRASSLWNKFRQSASQSVLSLAPSGSMLDMHLGMSMDKHAQFQPYDAYGNPNPRGGGRGQTHSLRAYPSMSDPAVARHADHERGRERIAQASSTPAKPKKKGIKGFFSKLISSGDASKSRNHAMSASEPGAASRSLGLDDDDDGHNYLAPPPPLSALANEPQYHSRSLSNSSVDSIQQPFTPPTSSAARGPPPGTNYHPYSLQTDYGRSGTNPMMPGDRGSILTNGSFSSVRSFKQPLSTSPVPGGRNSFQRPSMDYLSPDASPPRHTTSYLPRASSPEVLELEREEEVLYASVRREKSLPSLPSEAASQNDPAATFPFPLQHQSNLPYSSIRDSRSAYSIRTPSLSPPRVLGARDEWDNDSRNSDVDVGGGRKSKARSKVWSMNFGGFASGARKMGGGGGRPGSGAQSPEGGHHHEEKTDTVVREAALEGIRREGGLVSHPWFYFDALHKRYGPLVHLNMLGQHHILVGDGELAQELFARRSATYSSRTNSLYFKTHVAPHGRFASSSVMAATYGKHCPRSDDSAILDIVELNDLVAAGANPAASPINFVPWLDLLPDGLAPWRAHAAKVRIQEDKLYFGLLENASPSSTFWARRLEASKELAKAPVAGMPKLEPAFLAGQLVNAAAETVRLR
ncbi:hypothetical protein RQP46_010643 [Phenoliferia psychrophenolica]